MKKLLCLVLAFVLCSACALAATPSKTADDLISVTYEGENLPEGFSLVVDDSEEAVAAAETEISKLAEAESEAAYYGVDEAEITAILGEGEYHTDEFVVLAEGTYEESMGEVKVTVTFATPYENEEPVVIMVGTNGEAGLTWTPVAAAGNEDGAVEFIMPAELLAANSNSTMLIAAISK